MAEERTGKETIEERVKHLKMLASKGERYAAFTCDRMGYLNMELVAINKAGWKLHSVLPFVLPYAMTLDHMSYFCVIAELENEK